MSKMRERVAQAICQYFFDVDWPPKRDLDLGMGADDFRKCATAVLQAIKEPTDAMCDAGKVRCHNDHVPGNGSYCGMYLSDSPDSTWRAMVEKAME